MEDGADQDDDLAWPPPGGRTPPPPLPAPGPPGPEPRVASPQERPAARLDRGGAALAAGLFGALAGIALPPLLFWVTFTVVGWAGLPDTMILLASLGVAFGVPIVLFFRVMGLLARSSPRYDGARTALTVAASVSIGMWVLLAAVSLVAVFVLRDMGGS